MSDPIPAAEPLLSAEEQAALPVPPQQAPIQKYPANLNQDPKTGSQKAVWGTVVAFVVAVLGGVQLSLASGADLSNWGVWLNIVLVALVGGGATGGTVYQATNKVVYK